MQLKKTLFTLFIASSLCSNHVSAVDPGTGLMLTGIGLILYDSYPDVVHHLQNLDINNIQDERYQQNIILQKEKIKMVEIKLPQTIEEFLPKEKKEETTPKNFSNIAKEFAMNNSFKLTGAALVLYGYVWRQLSKGSKLAHDSHKWSSWKSHLSLEMLYELPKEQILQELQVSIYKCYGQSKISIEPLYKFIKDVQQEIKVLQRFVNFYTLLQRIFLSLLFPNFDEELLEAEETIERLDYLEELIADKIYEINS